MHRSIDVEDLSEEEVKVSIAQEVEKQHKGRQRNPKKKKKQDGANARLFSQDPRFGTRSLPPIQRPIIKAERAAAKPIPEMQQERAIDLGDTSCTKNSKRMNPRLPKFVCNQSLVSPIILGGVFSTI